MSKLAIILPLFLCFRIFGSTITPETQFSLLTAGPGEELYSVFGHSALRVSDPATGLDEVYNYGTFDFETPGFYLKFVRGQLLYQLSVTNMYTFIYEYNYEQRSVVEQVLNLTREEKSAIYDFLQVNRLPENRSYLYDFFYDNCSTRIRDIAEMLLDVDWGNDPLPGGEKSFRDLLQPCLTDMHWARFGIDLVLGLPADKIASPWHYMFLPDEMFMAFEKERHVDGRPLVDQTLTILHETPKESHQPLLTPIRAMWIIFVTGILLSLFPRFSMYFDRLLFSLPGIAGLVMLFLWFFSDHTATNYNINLLWALPTHLYFIFQTGRIRKNRIIRLYFISVIAINILLILFWHLIPQEFNPAFFPIIAITAIRSFFIISGRTPAFPLSSRHALNEV